MQFPLFVRTATSSWKLGGQISRVRTVRQLESECAKLRRALGWDALILARQWCDLAPAGRGIYGPIPFELRVWIVDQEPFAWSFHYMDAVAHPKGFPPSGAHLAVLRGLSLQVGKAFESRLVAADFARQVDGTWIFIEAGPGSCAGTVHEQVFKAVAARLIGQQCEKFESAVGGLFATARQMVPSQP